jgi:quercetin dioxygenase-like cupin family protein
MSTIRTLDELEGSPHANVCPGAEPKTIRLTLSAGESVPPHDHPDREIVLYVIEGAIDLLLGEDTHRVAAGEVASFDGAQDISPEAVEDATALLVLAERSGE